MWKAISPDKMLSFSLLGMTAVTGLIDAVSFLSLGHVFTANMTGNVVFLAFASAGVSELSVPRSFTALLGFLLGAVFGGRIMARATGESQIRLALVAFGVEIAFLLAATFCAIGYSTPYSPRTLQLYALIVLTAVAMGTPLFCFRIACKQPDWLHTNSHALSRASLRTTARPIHAKTNNTTPPTQPPRLNGSKKCIPITTPLPIKIAAKA